MRDFQLPGRSSVFATNGMCATSHPLAARTAIRILEDGGNAVDAAIGAAVLLGLCEPQSTGIGGDCFVLLNPPGTNEIIALNGSGRSPLAASASDLRERGLGEMPANTADAVTVPGAIDAFCRLSDDWGRVGLERSLAPAIHYAEAGVPVAPRVAFDWARSAGTLQGNARQFYLVDGKAPKPGTPFRVPAQAEVLRRIVKEGRDAFYAGEIAQDMVDCLRERGGVHTLDDLAAVKCSYGKPIMGPYADFEIAEHPPNGQGAAALLLANILSRFDLGSLDPYGSERTHIETEAAKLALDARDRFVADLEHTSRLDHVLSQETADTLAGLIDRNGVMDRLESRTEHVHRDTVLLVVVDRDLMSVTMIYSIFNSFGSGIASPKFGINFQNRGAGFTLEEGHPNEYGPGKRPMHTIIPAMLCRGGKVIMPFGVMGGQYQAAGHARLVSNIVDFGMHMQKAMDGPRSFPEQGLLKLERGYPTEVAAELAEIGHTVSEAEVPLGGAQAIAINHANGTLEGASDPRKDGIALGY